MVVLIVWPGSPGGLVTPAERNGVRLAYDQALRRRLAAARVHSPKPTRAEMARRRRLRAAIATDSPVAQTTQLFGVLAMLGRSVS
jgi:hypothetical protein